MPTRAHFTTMSETRNIKRTPLPEPTLRRLPWYLAYVRTLHSRQEQYVSSTQVAKAINVNAAQFAKDLSYLGIKGKPRIGYETRTLMQRLVDTLGFKLKHNAVVVGAGSLGGALMQDMGLSQYGLSIVAGFDVNPALTGTAICGIPIYEVGQLAERCRQFEATIAILTVPVEFAQQAADAAVLSGIKSIWNFTPVRIVVPPHVVVVDTPIYADLALLYNRATGNVK